MQRKCIRNIYFSIYFFIIVRYLFDLGARYTVGCTGGVHLLKPNANKGSSLKVHPSAPYIYIL